MVLSLAELALKQVDSVAQPDATVLLLSVIRPIMVEQGTEQVAGVVTALNRPFRAAPTRERPQLQ